MKQYVRIFNQLKETTSRIEKERILKENENNEGFKEILKFVYNPLLPSGLAKRKMEQELYFENCNDLRNIFEAIEYVINHNTGSQNVVFSVQRFINNLETQEEKDLAIGILTKDMPYGISRTTLNKVYGSSFIPKYSVQLAGRYVEGESKIDGKFALTLKLDGNRCTIFNFENGAKAFARSGKEIEGLDEILENFKKLPKNMVYDGELIAINKDNLTSKDLFRVTQTIVRKKGSKTGLNFVMFDMLPIEDFNNGSSKCNYEQRLFQMTLIKQDFEGELNFIKHVPIFYVGSDKEVINKYLDEVVSLGYEGLMINTLDGYYQTKRTKDLLKVKKFHTVDLRCLDTKIDIRGDKVGSLICDYKGYRVDVGGLTDKQKHDYFDNPELVVGKIIEVKYFEESTNAQGTISLRFPSFVRLRDDKDEVSYF